MYSGCGPALSGPVVGGCGVGGWLSVYPSINMSVGSKFEKPIVTV